MLTRRGDLCPAVTARSGVRRWAGAQGSGAQAPMSISEPGTASAQGLLTGRRSRADWEVERAAARRAVPCLVMLLLPTAFLS